MKLINAFSLSMLLIAVITLEACKPNLDDTVGLIRAGNAQACATNEVKERLRSELTWFLQFDPLKPTLGDGTSTKKFAYVFDPIAATSASRDAIECAATAYLSLDGKKPMASNTILLSYSLYPNLTAKDDFVLSGNFGGAREVSYILYQNVGAVDSPPSMYRSSQ